VTCHRAREVWQFFQFGPLAQDPPTFAGLLSSCCTSYETTTVFTAIAWNIWKRRNALIFNSEDEDIQALSRWCLADVRLWAFRCNSAVLSSSLKTWCIQFDPPGTPPPPLICNSLSPSLFVILLVADWQYMVQASVSSP
jgi:hypothetical protein